MEIKENINVAWQNENHPNYERWKRARDISVERGKFVKSIIEKQIKCENLRILDLGSGKGGTTKVLSVNNMLVSFDLNIIRLNDQVDYKGNIYRINGDALNLPLRPGSFDLIILQDVIEHINDCQVLISNLHGLLKEKGILFLSTPNKLSIFNMLADPHWGLPIVSLLKRETIRKYFLKYFRKSEANRMDNAELLSLNELLNLFKDKFRYTLYTSYSVEQLIKGNKGIIWSNFHLGLLKLIKIFKFDQLLLGVANDNPGIINKYFTPTYYFILEKI